MTGVGHLEAFAQVCRLHNSVVGTWPSPATRATVPTSPGATRAFALSGDAPAAARQASQDRPAEDVTIESVTITEAD